MNATTTQAGWIAYDNAFRAAGGGKHGDVAGMLARNAVIRLALTNGLLEGPAEEPGSFSRRSSARVCSST